MHEAGLQRRAERLRVHPRHHQDIAAGGIDGDAGDQAVRVEARREPAGFLDPGRATSGEDMS